MSRESGAIQSDRRFFPIGFVERSQVAIETRFNFFHPPFQLSTGEIAAAVIDGLEFTAVNGDQIFFEQS